MLFMCRLEEEVSGPVLAMVVVRVPLVGQVVRFSALLVEGRPHLHAQCFKGNLQVHRLSHHRSSRLQATSISMLVLQVGRRLRALVRGFVIPHVIVAILLFHLPLLAAIHAVGNLIQPGMLTSGARGLGRTTCTRIRNVPSAPVLGPGGRGQSS